MVPRFLVGLVSPLVESHRGNGKLHRLDIGVNEGLSGRESLAEHAHGRDVRRVHANERACGESAVKRALGLRYLRSGIRSGGGEVNHAAAGRLDGLDGRGAGIVLQHKRGPFRVQVGVGIIDEFESGSNVGKRDRVGFDCVGYEKNVCVVSGHNSIGPIQCCRSLIAPTVISIPHRPEKLS